MGLNIQTLSDVMRQRGAEDMAMQGQQDQRDMQKLQMMLTLKKLKEEADMKQQTGTMLKDLYRPEQPANPGTMGHGLGMGNPNAQPQLKQLMEQGGDFGMDNLNSINSSAEFSNKGAPVPMMAPQAAQAGGIDPMQLAAGFERMASQTGNVDFLTKAQELRKAMQKEGFTLGEGQYRFGSDGEVIAAVPKVREDKSPGAVQEYEYAVKQGYKGSFKDFKESNSKAGAPVSNIKIDNKTGESLAKEIGQIAEASLNRARAGVAKVQQGDRILQALDTGQVITGPGANIRLDALRLANVLGVSGKNDQEKLSNTQQVIKGLASITLEARQKLKGSGAITDKETDLLARAESGDINFTPTELRRLVEINRLSAKIDYDDHQRILTTMQSRPERSIAPYFTPPAFPEPYQGKQTQPTQPKPKTKMFIVGGKSYQGFYDQTRGQYLTKDGKSVLQE